MSLKKNVDRMKEGALAHSVDDSEIAQLSKLNPSVSVKEQLGSKQCVDRLKGEQSDISSFACESMLDMCGRRKTRPRVGLMNGAGASRSERRHRGLGEVWPSDPFFVVNLAYYGFESCVLDYTFLVYTATVTWKFEMARGSSGAEGRWWGRLGSLMVRCLSVPLAVKQRPLEGVFNNSAASAGGPGGRSSSWPASYDGRCWMVAGLRGVRA